MGLLSLIPLKDWLWATLVASLLIGGSIAWHEHNVHEQQLGAQRIDAAVKANTATLEAKNQKDLAKQASDDAAKLKLVEDGYAKKLDDSNKLTSDLNSRLRKLTALSGSGKAAVPGNSQAGSGSNDTGGIPSGVESAIEGVVTAAGHDADKVAALQDYINGVCLAPSK